MDGTSLLLCIILCVLLILLLFIFAGNDASKRMRRHMKKIDEAIDIAAEDAVVDDSGDDTTISSENFSNRHITARRSPFNGLVKPPAKKFNPNPRATYNSKANLGGRALRLNVASKADKTDIREARKSALLARRTAPQSIDLVTGRAEKDLLHPQDKDMRTFTVDWDNERHGKAVRSSMKGIQFSKLR